MGIKPNQAEKRNPTKASKPKTKKHHKAPLKAAAPTLNAVAPPRKAVSPPRKAVAPPRKAVAPPRKPSSKKTEKKKEKEGKKETKSPLKFEKLKEVTGTRYGKKGKVSALKSRVPAIHL